MTFFHSEMEIADKSLFCEPTRAMKSMTTALLEDARSMLAGIGDVPSVANLCKDFSKKEYSHQLNGLLISDVLRKMLNKKDYSRLDMVVPFVVSFMDRAMEWQKDQCCMFIAVKYLSKCKLWVGKSFWTKPEL